MKAIAVFGATGGTGQQIVAQAQARGYSVTALARAPEKLAPSARLTVHQGDALDASAVRAVVTGQDAVSCALGAGARHSTLRFEGTRNIVAAMKAEGVRRLVIVSSLGVGESRGNLPFLVRAVLVPLFLRHAFADHERQEACVRESGLEWTIVRPAALTDGPRTSRYRHGFAPDDRSVRGKISRADVADFVLTCLESGDDVRRASGLSY